MLPELAKEYSSYMKINVAQEINPIQDVVDDLLTRLEETESIISMIQKEQEQEDILPDLIQCNENLKYSALIPPIRLPHFLLTLLGMLTCFKPKW
ncbi:hypothetical protein M8J76_013310 [Diaphorina citri]|nr:hypothetical protein M8J76_013310 [Diaphorina citri]